MADEDPFGELFGGILEGLDEMIRRLQHTHKHLHDFIDEQVKVQQIGYPHMDVMEYVHSNPETLGCSQVLGNIEALLKPIKVARDTCLIVMGDDDETVPAPASYATPRGQPTTPPRPVRPLEPPQPPQPPKIQRIEMDADDRELLTKHRDYLTQVVQHSKVTLNGFTERQQMLDKYDDSDDAELRNVKRSTSQIVTQMTEVVNLLQQALNKCNGILM